MFLIFLPLDVIMAALVSLLNLKILKYISETRMKLQSIKWFKSHFVIYFVAHGRPTPVQFEQNNSSVQTLPFCHGYI